MTSNQVRLTGAPMKGIVLRTPRLVRALAVGAALLFTGLAWNEQASTSSSTPGWFLVFALVVGYIFCWVAAFRPRVKLDERHLAVINFLRAYRIPLAHIQDVEPSFDGLVISTRDGRRVTAVAVQRPNLWLFRKRRSRSDDFAAEILRRAGSSEH